MKNIYTIKIRKVNKCILICELNYARTTKRRSVPKVKKKGNNPMKQFYYLNAKIRISWNILIKKSSMYDSLFCVMSSILQRYQMMILDGFRCFACFKIYHPSLELKLDKNNSGIKHSISPGHGLFDKLTIVCSFYYL